MKCLKFDDSDALADPKLIWEEKRIFKCNNFVFPVKHDSFQRNH